MKPSRLLALPLLVLLAPAQAAPPRYDVVIRNGIVYDGNGSEPYVAGVAVAGDRIAAIGPHFPGRAPGVASADEEVDLRQ